MSKIFHPQPGESGERVCVEFPTLSGPVSAWRDPSAAATFSLTDPVELPRSINGVAFTHEHFEPSDWAKMMKQELVLDEPEYPRTQKRLTSGLVVAESDGRFWLVHPTNRFGGVEATFPKGRLEPGLSLLVNALKEAWEESGLLCSPVAYLCDVERTKTVTRYYVARRVAGSPADAGWESQAVSLVPAAELLSYLNRPNDRKVLAPLARWQLANPAALAFGSARPR